MFQPAQLQRLARILKFCMLQVAWSINNNGADQSVAVQAGLCICCSLEWSDFFTSRSLSKGVSLATI